MRWRVAFEDPGLNKPDRHDRVSEAALELTFARRVLFPQERVDTWTDADEEFGAAGSVIPLRREVNDHDLVRERCRLTQGLSLLNRRGV